MNRFKLEKLYEVNGLTDYKLKTPDNIFNTHGIDYMAVKGFESLDDLNRELYAKFIVNFMNGLGLDSRAVLIPKGIFYVEDYDFIAKEKAEDEYWQVTGGEVISIDRNGKRKAHRSWQNDDYQHLTSIPAKSEFYLRFEYKHAGRNEWLHVIDPKTWY